MNQLIYKQIFFFFLFLNPFLEIAVLGNQDYCSVKEKVYVYNTHFDKKPMENMFDDMYNDENLAEILTDEYFDFFGYSNESVQWRLNVKSISTDFEYYFKHNPYYYKKLRIDISEYREKNEASTRHSIERNIQYRLYEPNYEYMASHTLGIMEETFMLNIPFFMANNMDYDLYCTEINDYLDTDDFEVSVVSINFENMNVGYKIVYCAEEFEDMKDVIWLLKWNNDGVLYEASLTYENEFIYKFELDEFNKIWFENWILICLIIAIMIFIVYLYILYQLKIK